MIDAYSRGLAEFLQVRENHGIDPVTANRADVAVFVRELTGVTSRHGTNVVSIDWGVWAGKRHDPAAAGAGAAVLRFPGRGGYPGVESYWAGPVYALPEVEWTA